MNIDVMVNGRPWKVALAPAERGTVTVTIKGKSRTVDASWVDADTLSLIDAGVAREIRMHPRTEKGAVGVEIAGRVFEAIVAPPEDSGAKGAREALAASGATVLLRRGGEAAKADAAGSVVIKAPMPGRVVRVLVTAGDRVSARQGVVVVEAMKMENELRTPRDGVVTEVLVEPGARVETGVVLVVVE
jgi:biotin carboxyl carrier protein